MKIVSKISDMKFLLSSPLVALDIESKTTPSADHPAAGLKTGFGLSYNADIIAISLYAGPEHPTAVFLDVDKFSPEQKLELGNFLKAVLCRKVKILGHNVLFDLRSVGGHFGFLLPRTALVYDTMVMQRKLLLIDTPSIKTQKKGYFGLLNVAQKWNLISKDEDHFLTFMKAQRGSMSEFLDLQVEADTRHADREEDASRIDIPDDVELSEEMELAIQGAVQGVQFESVLDDAINNPEDIDKLVTAIRTMKDHEASQGIASLLAALPPKDPIWKFAGGYAPNKIAEKSRLLLETYVAYDAYLSYEIYLCQWHFMEQVSSCGKGKCIAPMPNINIPYWPDLPGLMADWQQHLRINANMAIRGLPVDMKYLKQRMDETRDKALELAPKLVFENDPSDPFQNFKEIFSQLLWYEMILGKLNDPKVQYNTPVSRERVDGPTAGWVNWQHIPLDPSLIFDALSFPNEVREAVKIGETITEKTSEKTGKVTKKVTPIYEYRVVEANQDELKQKWADWLIALTPETTFTEMKASLPDLRSAPKLDLLLWVKQQCFNNFDEPQASYFAHLKHRWLKSYYKSAKSRTAIELASALHFKPYYMFVVARWPLYTHTDLKYELNLGTKKFQERRNELEKLDPDLDLQQLAIQMDAFSCGKKPLEWVFKKIADWTDSGELEDHPEYAAGAAHLKEYEILLSQWSTHKRMVEYFLHAQRDGKVHSLQVPNTVTGRDGSTLPNLQNIKMADFAGIFVAPDGYTLVELDLSNAENMSSGLTSGDTNFIMAIMTGDYHLKQAHLYWPDIMRQLEAAGNAKGIKKQRSKGKSATFALPYGAGEKKMISLLGVSQADASSIIKRLKAAYPQMTRKKQELQDTCEERVKAGRFPAFTTLWNKARVMVESYQGRIQGYTIWNYILQGAVGAIIHGSHIGIEELIEEKQYESFMLLSVHDANIMAIKNEEYFETNIIQEICQIMGSQVPAELLNRTIPGVVFVTDSTPDNADKWGKRMDRPYPFPKDEFINQWGRFPYDAKTHETWKGPMHTGWTLEKEIADRTAGRTILSDNPDKTAVAIIQPKAEKETIMSAKKWPEELEDVISTAMADRRLVYRSPDGKEKLTPILDYPELLKVAEVLAHRGAPMDADTILAALDPIEAWLRAKLETVQFIKKEMVG